MSNPVRHERPYRRLTLLKFSVCAVAAVAACRSAPVVVFSDERDVAYRQALRDALATGDRRVVLGDEAVRAAVGDADNYFVFAVAAAVLARGSHVLDIRRGHCPGPCVKP